MSWPRPPKLQTSHCCICGQATCREATDHSTLPLSKLIEAVRAIKLPYPQLDELKDRLKTYYEQLKGKLVRMVDQDCNSMQEALNQRYYSHLKTSEANLEHICQIANGRYDRLPSKRVLALMSCLKGACNTGHADTLIELSEAKEKIINFIEESQTGNLTDRLKSVLPFESVMQKPLPELKVIRSLSEISNPEEADEQAAKTYTWKNVTIRSRTKILQLSNKGITDSELLREMPVLSSFKNIKDFQIRNNKITAFSCKIIGSNMGHVKSVDIRGNPVGDEGVLAIVRGMPQLRSLMVSETKCTNVSASAIVRSMPDLQMLWCEHNHIDDVHALQVGRMAKLKVLSFAGNGLAIETMEQLRKVFNSKGYVIV